MMDVNQKRGTVAHRQTDNQRDRQEHFSSESQERRSKVRNDRFMIGGPKDIVFPAKSERLKGTSWKMDEDGHSYGPRLSNMENI